MRLYNFNKFPLQLIWLLIFGLFIDAINVDEIIGVNEMIHEEYDGESINAEMVSQNIDVTDVNSFNTSHAIQNENARSSHGFKWIDADSLSVAAPVISDGEELLLLLKQQSTQNYSSTFIPVTTPIALGKLLI